MEGPFERRLRYQGRVPESRERLARGLAGQVVRLVDVADRILLDLVAYEGVRAVEVVVRDRHADVLVPILQLAPNIKATPVL